MAQFQSQMTFLESFKKEVPSLLFRAMSSLMKTAKLSSVRTKQGMMVQSVQSKVTLTYIIK